MKYLTAILLLPLWSISFAANPETCEGYPENRWFLESQGWWVDADHPFPGAHVHMGTCFPLQQDVSGTVHLDTRIMLHDMQGNGAVKFLRVQIFGNGSGSQYTTTVPLSLSCPTRDCTWWVPVNVDTTRVPYDGNWEWRITANVPNTANGDRIYQTTRWHAYLNNGSPVKNAGESPNRSPGAGGWYTGVDYTNVFCGYDDTGFQLVSGPQFGTVTMKCKFARSTAFASIDPAFHAVPFNPGTVILNQSSGGIKTFTIDTTQLSDGEHKLFMRTQAPGSNPPGTGSGVLVLPFVVQNNP